MKLIWRYILIIGFTLGLAALLTIAFLPSPIKVDVARAERGSLQVTVDEDGKTRVRDRFVVAAPVAGRLARIELVEGDIVESRAVIARIDPLPIDQKQRTELRARISAAEASKHEAQVKVENVRTDLEQARRELERAEQLAKSGLIPRQKLELAENDETNKEKELEAAIFRAQAAAFQVEIEKAGLLAIESEQGNSIKTISIHSPVRGRVLRVIEKSERVVMAGTPLLELGDPSKIEIVIDVLSADAVKVSAGTPVAINDWGGDQPLKARVRFVEPSAFTKISALGIEEQRVNVIADFVDPPRRLGDGYSLDARIIIWEGKNVLKIPSSALFRHGQDWSLFVVKDSKARRREVEVGHRNALEVEILHGLEENAKVIIHPTNQLEDGVPVEVRQ